MKFKTIKKENLIPGDVLHCTRNTLLSKIIRLFTKSRISHNALVISIWDELYIIDAQKDGINPRKLENWISKFNYTYQIHRNVNPNFDLKSYHIKAISKSGSTPYDFKSLLWYQPIYLLTGKWCGKKYEDSTKRMYCSEYAAWVVGIDNYWKLSAENVFEEIEKRSDYKLI